jgi:hypothetical protein
LKRTWTLAAILLLVPGTTGRSQAPEDPSKLSEYFPLVKGATWTYNAPGNKKITVRVIGFEKKFNKDCARLETTIDRKVVGTEHVVVLPDGVYRVAVNDKKVEPPLCFLKLPPKPGTRWPVGSVVDGEKLSGTFTLSEQEITVPAFKEKLKVVVVSGETLRANGQSVSLAYYFAPGKGLVKQTSVFDKLNVELILVEYKKPMTE